jgi:hypothetical protein
MRLADNYQLSGLGEMIVSSLHFLELKGLNELKNYS